MDVNWTYCDHFVIRTNIKSLCCTFETNVMLCQLNLNEKVIFDHSRQFLKYK